MLRSAIPILALLLLPSLAAATKSDWPMFRGDPALTGVSPARVPDKPVLAWKFQTGGPVSSSAAILGDRVFIGSADSNVVCLSLQDGRKLWSFRASGPIEASPLVLDGRVYIGDVNTHFYCLDAASGTPVWSRGFDDKIKSSANWIASVDGKSRNVLVGGYDFRLYSFDAVTGRSNWVYETGNYINGSAAISGGLTAFGGCDAIVHVVDVVNGKKIREIEAGAYIAASGAMDNGHLYVGHYENELLSVDVQKRVIDWRYRDRAFPFMSSPAVTPQRILVGSRDKRLHCVNRADGKAVWTFQTRGKVESSPVVAGDRVVVGSDDGRLYIVSLEDGSEVWNYEIGQPVQSSPAVVEGHIVVGSDDGFVYAFTGKK
jgi:outer membrane protein assembly factor BamB